MNYSPDTLKEVVSKEHKLKEFFLSVNVALRKTTVATSSQVYGENERILLNKFIESKQKVHAALCDNFNYPIAMEQILNLVAATNKYLIEEDKKPQDKKNPQGFLLQRIAVYVDHMLDIFGVKGNNDSSFGFTAQSENQDKAVILKSFLDAFSDFRYKVRTAAQEKKDLSEILNFCDIVRDQTLPDLGVRLEDVKDGPSVWKLDDAGELKKQRDEKEQKATEQQVKKLEGQFAQRQKDLLKWKDKSKTPEDFFAQKKQEYSAFDEKGFPTKDAEGRDLAPSKIKKLVGVWKKQEKDYNDYKTALAKDSLFLSKLEEEVNNLSNQISKRK